MVVTQLAKFSGPTAGSHRQFDRSAGGSRRRSESGSAKRRDGGLLAANGRPVTAVSYTHLTLPTNREV